MQGTGNTSVHSFTWCENYIHFWSALGAMPNYSQENLITHWFYTGRDIPPPSTERVHINFWLRAGLAPSDAQEAEIIVESFQFIPSNCDDLENPFLWLVWVMGIFAIAGISTVAFLKLRKK